jgi:hypothetical protein
MTGVYQQNKVIYIRQKRSSTQQLMNTRAARMTIVAKQDHTVSLTERWSQLLLSYSDYLIRY